MFSRKSKVLKKKISKPSKKGKLPKKAKQQPQAPPPEINNEEIESLSSDAENNPNMENAPSVHSDDGFLILAIFCDFFEKIKKPSMKKDCVWRKS